MRRRIAFVIVFGALLIAPADASADHHLIKISEYYPGTLALSEDGFLELQMYSAGQNLVGGQEIHVYDSAGDPPEPAVYVVSPFLPAPANSESQRTILISGSNDPADGDYTENLDLEYDPAGGGLCFVSTEGFGAIDCLEWGSGTALIDAGAPVLPGGIPETSSVTRSIAPGCATLLEAGDDSDDSATDFAATTPSPRPNSVAPTEKSCGPGGGDDKAPETEITKAPPNKTETAKAKYKFASDEPNSTFECLLKGKGLKKSVKRFGDCESPRKYKRLDEGRFKFKVRAIDAVGNVDPTPAQDKFKVVN